MYSLFFALLSATLFSLLHLIIIFFISHQYWPGTYSIAGDETNTISITQDVSFTENTTPKVIITSRWFISNIGETCDTTCERMGDQGDQGDGGGEPGECDATEMILFANKLNIKEQYEIASTLYACRQPMLISTCEKNAIFNFDHDGSCYSTPSTCINNQTSLCSTAATNYGKICACKKSMNVNYAIACPSAIITNHGGDGGDGGSVSSPSPTGTGGGGGESGGESGNSGSVSSPSPSSSSTTVEATLRNVKLNLDINIKLRGSTEAWITLTGPSNKYFAIAFNTMTMDHSYSIIFEPMLDPHERTLGSHAPGTKLTTSFTYIDHYGVENGARRTQTVMRPITHQDNDPNYYSFANVLQNGGKINIILAVGQSSNFKYHSPDNKAVATLDFGKGDTTDGTNDGTTDGTTGGTTGGTNTDGSNSPAPTSDGTGGSGSTPGGGSNSPAPASGGSGTGSTTTAGSDSSANNANNNAGNNANNANTANNANISQSKSNDSSKNGSANSKTIGWMIGLVVFFLLVVAVASFLYFSHKTKTKMDMKEAPAVAIDVELSTKKCNNPSVITINSAANPLDDFRLNHRVDHHVLEMVENPAGLPARRKPRKKKTTPTLPTLGTTTTTTTTTTTLCLLCLISFISFDVVLVDGHNWVANPKSRIGGLGRTAPCPPRVGKSLHIAVRQSETFPIEWSDGHPGSYIYYTMVPREHEAKLKELNVSYYILFQIYNKYNNSPQHKVLVICLHFFFIFS